jgi:tRNA(Ile)-lysidine synthase
VLFRSRQEVLRYLEQLNQPYRIDSSNLTPKYTRNRIRLEVLPILEELYPGAGGNIAQGASRLRDDLEVLEGLISGVVHQRAGEAVVPLAALMEMPVALRRHAVRRAYSTLVPDAAVSLDSAIVEDILRLARKSEGTRVLQLPGNMVAAVRFGEELALYWQTDLFSGEKDLLVGKLDFAGWLVDVREVQDYDPEDAARPEISYLDARPGPYKVRFAREGDIIRPLGLEGTKKVHKAMMDRKVPKDQRRRTPVVVDGRGRVAWVFMGETSEEFKVGSGTEKALRLEVEKLS